VRGAGWTAGSTTLELDDSTQACGTGSSETTVESVILQLGASTTPAAGPTYTVGGASGSDFVLDVLFAYPDAGSADLTAASGTLTFSSVDASGTTNVAVGDFDVVLPDLPDGGADELVGHFDAPYCAQ
jgi:hypothetical protein